MGLRKEETDHSEYDPASEFKGKKLPQMSINQGGKSAGLKSDLGSTHHATCL